MQAVCTRCAHPSSVCTPCAWRAHLYSSPDSHPRGRARYHPPVGPSAWHVRSLQGLTSFLSSFDLPAPLLQRSMGALTEKDPVSSWNAGWLESSPLTIPQLRSPQAPPPTKPRPSQALCPPWPALQGGKQSVCPPAQGPEAGRGGATGLGGACLLPLPLQKSCSPP